MNREQSEEMVRGETLFQSPWARTVLDFSGIPKRESERQFTFTLGSNQAHFFMKVGTEARPAGMIILQNKGTSIDPVASYRSFLLVQELLELNAESVGHALYVSHRRWDEARYQKHLPLLLQHIPESRVNAVMTALPPKLEDVVLAFGRNGVNFETDGLIDEVEAGRITVNDFWRSVGVDRRATVLARDERMQIQACEYDGMFRRAGLGNHLPRLRYHVAQALMRGIEEKTELLGYGLLQFHIMRASYPSPTLVLVGGMLLLMTDMPEKEDPFQKSAAAVHAIIPTDTAALATRLQAIQNNWHTMPITQW